VTDETRARFLTAIAAQLPVARIAEVHLFPAIRQGGLESGVAVVAVELPDVAAPTEPVADAAAIDADVVERRPDDAVEELLAGDLEDATDLAADFAPAPAPRRYTVFSARYRHTLKGPDRGKWETSVTEEADAPLRTVDAVVRGVQRRSGGVDEIVRVSGDELRATIPATGTP
jgi:hypothetical protein